MGFWDFGKESGHDVIVRQPSLAGRFADVGIPERTQTQNIYVSPQTQQSIDQLDPKLLGVAAEISGADNVIFVSDDDIRPEIEKIDAQRYGTSNILHGDDYAHYGEAFDAFRTGFKDAPPIIVPKSAQHAYNEDASAQIYHHENGQSYCVITLPRMDDTADSYFRRVGGVKGFTKTPDGELVKTQINIPESEALDKAVVAEGILHEAAHCGLQHPDIERTTPEVLNEEQEADAVGHEVVQYVFPDVGTESAQVTRDARAFGAIALDDPDHAGNMDLHFDSSVSPEDQVAGHRHVHDAVVDKVAEMVSTDRHEARELLNSDPQLMHSTLDQMNQEGAFLGNKAAQAYVDSYLDVGQRRVPEYVGVQPKSTPDASPAPVPVTPGGS